MSDLFSWHIFKIPPTCCRRKRRKGFMRCQCWQQYSSFIACLSISSSCLWFQSSFCSNRDGVSLICFRRCTERPLIFSYLFLIMTDNRWSFLFAGFACLVKVWVSYLLCSMKQLRMTLLFLHRIFVFFSCNLYLLLYLNVTVRGSADTKLRPPWDFCERCLNCFLNTFLYYYYFHSRHCSSCSTTAINGVPSSQSCQQ